jgi:hypothetical protein
VELPYRYACHVTLGRWETVLSLPANRLRSLQRYTDSAAAAIDEPPCCMQTSVEAMGCNAGDAQMCLLSWMDMLKHAVLYQWSPPAGLVLRAYYCRTPHTHSHRHLWHRSSSPSGLHLFQHLSRRWAPASSAYLYTDRVRMSRHHKAIFGPIKLPFSIWCVQLWGCAVEEHLSHILPNMRLQCQDLQKFR